MKQMTIELAAKKYKGEDYFYASLDLPATKRDIENAKQIARWNDADLVHKEILVTDSIRDCLEDVSFDTTGIEELNYLAKRLDSLTISESEIFDELAEQYSEEQDFDLLSVPHLINLTYGLENIQVMHGIRNAEELGDFVIENDLWNELSEIPESMIPYLDRKKIGETQAEAEGGIFRNGSYIVADYEYKEVYDGEIIPETYEPENSVFAIIISSPEGGEDFITLPKDTEELAEIFDNLRPNASFTCVVYDHNCGISCLQDREFTAPEDIFKLNVLAEKYFSCSSHDRMIFNAVCEAEEVTNSDQMINAFDTIQYYELCRDAATENAFFKKYLAYHLPSDFDDKWVEKLGYSEDSRRLFQRLGAHRTSYGILSGRGRSLFENVSYSPETQREKYDLIEVCGQKALFSNSSIRDSAIPSGLFCYDLRSAEDSGLCFASIENFVFVNRAGTVLTKEPIDLGMKGYIEFTEETSPNFLGEEMSAEEFKYADFSEEINEERSGGMKL